MRLARIGNAGGKTSAEAANARVRGVGVALRACLRFAETERVAGGELIGLRRRRLERLTLVP
jgi:hypothetical protein